MTWWLLFALLALGVAMAWGTRSGIRHMRRTGSRRGWVAALRITAGVGLALGIYCSLFLTWSPDAKTTFTGFPLPIAVDVIREDGFGEGSSVGPLFVIPFALLNAIILGTTPVLLLVAAYLRRQRLVSRAAQ